jgi:hypothetical protein
VREVIRPSACPAYRRILLRSEERGTREASMLLASIVRLHKDGSKGPKARSGKDRRNPRNHECFQTELGEDLVRPNHRNPVYAGLLRSPAKPGST